MTRRDTLKCIHEPFGDAFYYGPERLSPRYEDDEQARFESGFSLSTYKTIFDRLEREASEVWPFFPYLRKIGSSSSLALLYSSKTKTSFSFKFIHHLCVSLLYFVLSLIGLHQEKAAITDGYTNCYCIPWTKEDRTIYSNSPIQALVPLEESNP